MKRFLSIALALCLLLSLLPVGVFAADIVESGSCGEHTSWTLDSDGVLTISGTGEMRDGNWDDMGTYIRLAENVKSIVVLPGVTSLGNSAFVGFRNATSVTLPESVVRIGYNAFMQCSGLTEVTIPSGVTQLEDRLFWQCTALKSVKIPEGVTTIGQGVFEECENLTSVNIPGGVTGIGRAAFSGCKSLKSVTLPEGLTVIEDGLFRRCESLTSVNIPAGVTSIGANAFYSCFALPNVEIPAGVKEIGACAFAGCRKMATVNLPKGMTEIRDEVFSGCARLSEVAIPEGVQSIGESAFAGCSNLAAVSLPESLTSIGASAFSNCGLQSVAIPRGVTGIGHGAFGACDFLRQFLVADRNGVFCSVDGVLYSKDQTELLAYPSGKGTSFEIPSGTVRVGEGAFQGCRSLESVTVPESVTDIGAYAFKNCQNLAAPTLPAGVTSIGDSAFFGCGAFTQFAFPECLQCIGENAFRSCSGLTEVKIPEGVIAIGNHAFTNCTGLKSAAIPGTVQELGEAVFSGCGALQTVTLREGVSSVPSGMFRSCSSLTNVSIPSSVKRIEDYVFDYCSSLTEITIPDGVEEIWGYAFHNCENLERITIPKSVTSLRNIEGCGKLTDIYYGGLQADLRTYNLPANVVIHYAAAQDPAEEYLICSVQNGEATIVGVRRSVIGADLVIPDTIRDCPVTAIADEALAGLGMQTVRLPETLKSIGAGAFSSCENLTAIAIPDGVETIGSRAFYFCRNLREVTLPNSITDIGQETFMDCHSLRVLALPEGLTRIAQSLLERCANLTSVTIPDTVAVIDDAFRGCGRLTDVYYHGTFAQWSAIQIDPSNHFLLNAERHYDEPGDALEIRTEGQNAVITDCDPTVSTMEIPEEIDGKPVTGIDEGAFSECAGLTTVTIPERVTEIGADAFSGCGNLEFLALMDSADAAPLSLTARTAGKLRIGAGAFSGCDKLQTVWLTKSLVSVAENAFSGAPVQDVCFRGTEAEWAQIAIVPAGNEPLLRAQLHFNVHEHVVFPAQTAATCTHSGEAPHWRCNRCGKLFGDVAGTREIHSPAVIPALGHDWSGWVVTTPATADAEGEETRTCARCGETETRSIPKTAPQPGRINPFADVASGAYYFDSVLWAVEKGITLGTDASHFSPGKTCTRGQVVTFLWRAAGSPKSAGGNPFKDVKATDYYYDAVLWAAANGITQGTSATAFSPGASCTRAQVVTFLWRARSQPAGGSRNPFGDVASGAYYYNAVLWAVQAGITQGTSATAFSPNATCTRAQIVTFLYRDMG